MQKLLISLISLAACSSAFAATAVSYPITCANGVSISQTSKLAEVQKCAITKEETSDGMYKVEFTDNNKHKYSCYFANSKPYTTINHCSS